MHRYNIGIDTGGTYTDAVVMDMHRNKVIAAAKELTTYGDLAQGVTRALDSVLRNPASQLNQTEIGLVSLSTTLATNALVEGKRARVGVMLIGFNDAMAQRTQLQTAMPEARVFRIEGGHNYAGDELSPLNEQAIRAALQQAGNSVDAYAIASHYAVRNSAHEKRAATLVKQITGLPVTVSRDLSDALDGPKRALTAAFNASIVSRIVALIHAVTAALESHKISAPLMVVKGDGSLAPAAEIVRRPIETILSGPAASVIGARYLSGLKAFAVADVGGTTTDIAIARNGWPSLSEKGSRLGQFRTLVKAVNMQTVALGGDSEVSVDFSGRITLGPGRILPVALLGRQWPEIRSCMRNALSEGKGLRRAGRFVLLSQMPGSSRATGELRPEELELLGCITETPRPLAEVVARASDESRLERLTQRGLVQVAGFTPSDAAHTLGLQSQWCEESARLACEIAGRSCGRITLAGEAGTRQRSEFAQDIFDNMVQASTHLMAEQLSATSLDPEDPIIAAVTSGIGHLNHLGISFKPDIPIIGVGGPARLIYPSVGSRLGAEVLIPEFNEVANAIGAATGMIKSRVTMEITQREDGGFLLHHEDHPVTISSGPEALAQAEALVRQAATTQCEAMGGRNLEVEISIERVDLPHVDSANSLIAATIAAECTGIPDGGIARRRRAPGVMNNLFT